jgi:hypothetical protein
MAYRPFFFLAGVIRPGLTSRIGICIGQTAAVKQTVYAQQEAAPGSPERAA